MQWVARAKRADRAAGKTRFAMEKALQKVVINGHETKKGRMVLEKATVRPSCDPSPNAMGSPSIYDAAKIVNI
jgi:hypothetical protein